MCKWFASGILGCAEDCERADFLRYISSRLDGNAEADPARALLWVESSHPSENDEGMNERDFDLRELVIPALVLAPFGKTILRSRSACTICYFDPRSSS